MTLNIKLKDCIKDVKTPETPLDSKKKKRKTGIYLLCNYIYSIINLNLVGVKIVKNYTLNQGFLQSMTKEDSLFN